MRPAQKAPENRVAGGDRGRRGRDFNEAGAKSAGKRHHIYLFETKRQISGGFEHHPKFDELHVSNINFM